MENKQKPSLFLVGDHSKIDQEGIPFEETMLTWPLISFVDYPEPSTDVHRDTVIKNVLAALAQLQPFEIRISITAEIEEKRLCYEYRTWGRVSLNGEKVIAFMHNHQKENVKFSNIEEWAEREDGNEQYHLFSLAKWPVEKWVRFFQAKITERALQLTDKARAKKKDARALEKSANALLKSINNEHITALTQNLE